MKKILPLLSLVILVGLTAGFLGSYAYNKVFTPKVLGATTEKSTQKEVVKNILKGEFEGISFEYPSTHEITKESTNNESYVKLAGAGEVIIISKNDSNPIEIGKAINCEGKNNCQQVVKGSNTYLTEPTGEGVRYATAKDNNLLIIKFGNTSKNTQDLILSTLTW